MASIRKDILAAAFSGECNIGLIDQRHVLFKFQLEADFHRMWMKKTWGFGGFQAKIFRWSIHFTPETEPSITPVWISFPMLPIHLCNKDTLFSLGSAVGNPLKLDLATAAMDKVLRPSEARLCIEVDVLKHLPHRVWIGSKEKGRWQPIQFEDLPEYCTTCSKMGHSKTACRPQVISNSKSVAPPSTKTWVPKLNPISGGETSGMQLEISGAPSSKGKAPELDRSRTSVSTPQNSAETSQTAACSELPVPCCVDLSNAQIPDVCSPQLQDEEGQITNQVPPSGSDGKVSSSQPPPTCRNVEDIPNPQEETHNQLLICTVTAEGNTGNNQVLGHVQEDQNPEAKTEVASEAKLLPIPLSECHEQRTSIQALCLEEGALTVYNRTSEIGFCKVNSFSDLKRLQDQPSESEEEEQDEVLITNEEGSYTDSDQFTHTLPKLKNKPWSSKLRKSKKSEVSPKPARKSDRKKKNLSICYAED